MRDEPLNVKNENGIPIWGHCPVCNSQITKTGSPRFCKWCGQQVKWGAKNETFEKCSK